MNKFLIMLLAVSILVGCNSSSETTETSDTTTVITSDTAQVVTDTTIETDTIDK